MTSNSIVVSILTASIIANAPASAEAILSQDSIKPFAVRAMGFDKPGFIDAARIVRLPRALEPHEESEMQVPGLVAWPVQSERPAIMLEIAVTGPAEPSQKRPEPASEPQIPAGVTDKDTKNPRVW